MLRDPGLYLQDIADACRKVQILVVGMDLETFSEDWRTRDAVLFNLQLIGEAVKRLPDELESGMPHIPWRRIAGFREVPAHAYFSLDDSIVWDVATGQMSPLLGAATGILSRMEP